MDSAACVIQGLRSSSPFSRLVSLVFALLIVASGSTASAESAWVFWLEEHSLYNVKPPQSFDEWFFYSSYAGHAECEAALETKAQQMMEFRRNRAAATQTISRDGSIISSVISKSSDGKVVVTSHSRLLCLPDTVNPRGPKGGGR